MSDFVYHTKEDFSILCSELNNFLTSFKDPPPKFENTNFDNLDSVIHAPQLTYDGADLYPTIYDKACCYFYFINKTHPFENGNKRLSIVATSTFLVRNGFDFTLDEDNMYKFATTISTSNERQDNEKKQVVEYIHNHTVEVNKLEVALKQIFYEIFRK